MKREVKLKSWSSTLEEVTFMKLWSARGDAGNELEYRGRPKFIIKANVCRRSHAYILFHTPHVSLFIRMTLCSFFFISS